MTGVRQSIVFQIEDQYGQGNPSRTNSEGVAVHYWVAAPPGSFFDSTHRRNVQRIQGMGSKFWDTVSYGALQGTWEWTFYLDYNYPEPLFLIFEGGRYTNVYARNILEFVKNNSKRIPSFTVRRKILNDFIGGADNEVTILKGCVVRSATFSKSSGASFIKVSMSGFYATEELLVMPEELMDETDYTEYEGNLVEYACLTSAELSDLDSNNASLIQNTDSVTITIDNSAEAIYNTCSPFSSEYAEGQSNISLSASSYANHPSYYKAGVYTGGQGFNSIMDVLSSGATLAPGSKGMRPLDDAYLTSYDAMARNTGGIIGRAYGQSSKSSEMHLEDVVMNSLTWQKGDGGKLMDSISNCPVRKLTIRMTTPATQPYTESANEDAWRDLFYSVAERKADGTKMRVNNVFVEAPELVTDEAGIIYAIYKDRGVATVYSAPSGLSGDIVLLNEVPSETGWTYPVVEIERQAFWNSSARPVSITSVDIPPNIREIGDYAFYSITTLTTVTGGTSLVDGVIDPNKGITKIGAGAFMRCTNLASCSLLESTDEAPVPLVVIRAGAFTRTAIVEAVIPATVTTIENSSRQTHYDRAMHGAFANCPSLSRVTLPINICYVAKDDGGYYDRVFYNSNAIEEFDFIQGGDEVPDYSPEEGADVTANPEKFPSLKTPWYAMALRVAAGTQDNAAVTWDYTVKSMPRYMFYVKDGDAEAGAVYSMSNLTIYLTYVGRYAFYRCGMEPLDSLDLRYLKDIEEMAFVDPVNVSAVKVASGTLTYLPEGMVVLMQDGDLSEADFGGCTADISVTRTMLTATSLDSIVVPPHVKSWSKSAVVLTEDPDHPYIMFRVPSGGTFTKVAYNDGGLVSDISLIASFDGTTPGTFHRSSNPVDQADADAGIGAYFDRESGRGTLTAGAVRSTILRPVMDPDSVLDEPDPTDVPDVPTVRDDAEAVRDAGDEGETVLG